MMTKREVIKCVIAGDRPPYVPWSFTFAAKTREKLAAQFGPDYDNAMGNHLLVLGHGQGFFNPVGPNVVRDHFGTDWDRTIDQDIGNICNRVLPEPTLANYTFPNPHDEKLFSYFPDRIAANPDLYRVFNVGFSLYERAWGMRGMENLMMDFYDDPEFVRELFRKIADFNIAYLRKAMEYDIDAVSFRDDWGQQIGLQMGRRTWTKFIYPELKRMYDVVHEYGKAVWIHCCGDVDELLDDLVGIGLNCFNPFQPEVMDVYALLERYRGRLSFHGGLSTQKTLPFGTPDDVRAETRSLLAAGAAGGYIMSPSHLVQADVPMENILAFVEEAQRQV